MSVTVCKQTTLEIPNVTYTRHTK